jgi:transcriptional regulator with XRE-family HTH domain
MAKTIRALRQARGWTQFELAIRVGVKPQAVYFWESGRRTPQVPQLRRLGALFGICSDEIELVPPRGGAPEAYRPHAADFRDEPSPGRNAGGSAPSSADDPADEPPAGHGGQSNDARH